MVSQTGNQGVYGFLRALFHQPMPGVLEVDHQAQAYDEKGS